MRTKLTLSIAALAFYAFTSNSYSSANLAFHHFITERNSEPAQSNKNKKEESERTLRENKTLEEWAARRDEALKAEEKKPHPKAPASTHSNHDNKELEPAINEGTSKTGGNLGGSFLNTRPW